MLVCYMFYNYPKWGLEYRTTSIKRWRRRKWGQWKQLRTKKRKFKTQRLKTLR